MVYGSALTCVRFEPTGSPGGGGELDQAGDEEVEQPASASANNTSRQTGPRLPQKRSVIVLQRDYRVNSAGTFVGDKPVPSSLDSQQRSIATSWACQLFFSALSAAFLGDLRG